MKSVVSWTGADKSLGETDRSAREVSFSEVRKVLARIEVDERAGTGVRAQERKEMERAGTGEIIFMG